MKIITLGSGATGSSAIEEYLYERKDVRQSAIRREFRLIQDPGGISDLHASLCFGFHTNRASAAIASFKDLCYRYGNPKSTHPKGLNYRKNVKNYDQIVDAFIDRITTVSYSGMPFCERSKLSKWDLYWYEKKRIKAKKEGGKPSVGLIRLPVTENIFLEEVKTFIDEIFAIDSDSNQEMPVVIEQGGSFWSPVSSTQYYRDRKILVVTRDPRDILCDIIDDGYAYPGRDIETYCSWFKGMMKHVDEKEWESDLVYHIEFENFVLNYNEQKKKLDRFLGIDENVVSTYDPNLSAKNIGKHKEILNQQEVDFIESQLSEYLKY